MRPTARLRPRGQTLVLFALTLLLLVLMVLVTLGVGMKAREKQELQTLADAAAYSNAVATARTYNNIALLNRVQVSYWVSMLTDQGLISWSSFQRAQLAAIQQSLSSIAAGTGTATGNCPQPAASQLLAHFTSDALGDAQALDEADRRAGEEVLAIQGIVSSLSRQMQDIRNQLLLVLNPLANPLTEGILREAAVGTPGLSSELGQNVGAASLISRREVDCVAGIGAPYPLGSGLCERTSWSSNLHAATYGSRGNPWTIEHGNPVGQKLQQLIDTRPQTPPSTFDITGTGGAVIGQDAEDSSARRDRQNLFAHDHGQVTVTVNGCSATVDTSALVRSTDLQDSPGDDLHVTVPAVGLEPDVERHTLGRCDTCPSVWVVSLAFDPGPGHLADLHGQPKLYTSLHRDLAARGKGDPWDLFFRFRFAKGGEGEVFDNRGRVLRALGGEQDMGRQGAFATGMAYYHRKGHWDEYPNLLNPFWRSTLVAADVDVQGKLELGFADVPLALSGQGAGFHAEAYRALNRAGFRGVH